MRLSQVFTILTTPKTRTCQVHLNGTENFTEATRMSHRTTKRKPTSKPEFRIAKCVY